MYDFEIAFYLYKMSRLLEIFERNKYKAEAYFKAAMAIDSYSTFITEAYKSDSLKDIEGIGDSSARIIKAVIETGRCHELETLEEKYNVEDYSLILSHGLSTNTIRIQIISTIFLIFHQKLGYSYFFSFSQTQNINTRMKYIAQL